MSNTVIHVTIGVPHWILLAEYRSLVRMKAATR
jgi:hypothetical protein